MSAAYPDPDPTEKDLWSRTLPDWEIWACAHAIERQHGTGAAEFILGRITAMEMSGDDAGMQTWKRIARAYEALMVENRSMQ